MHIWGLQKGRGLSHGHTEVASIVVRPSKAQPRMGNSRRCNAVGKRADPACNGEHDQGQQGRVPAGCAKRGGKAGGTSQHAALLTPPSVLMPIHQILSLLIASGMDHEPPMMKLRQACRQGGLQATAVAYELHVCAVQTYQHPTWECNAA